MPTPVARFYVPFIKGKKRGFHAEAAHVVQRGNRSVFGSTRINITSPLTSHSASDTSFTQPRFHPSNNHTDCWHLVMFPHFPESLNTSQCQTHHSDTPKYLIRTSRRQSPTSTIIKHLIPD